MQPSYISGKYYGHFKKQFSIFLNLNIYFLHDLAILLLNILIILFLNIYIKRDNICSHKDLYGNIHRIILTGKENRWEILLTQENGGNCQYFQSDIETIFTFAPSFDLSMWTPSIPDLNIPFDLSEPLISLFFSN